MDSRKEVLLKEIESFRFRTISEDIFELYDEYESLCLLTEDSYELLNLGFYRGEAYFRLGYYQKSQELINSCLLKHPLPSQPEINAKCHNILGLIYSSMGYQMVALENFLSGLDFATQVEDSRQKTVIQLNMGWLYRDLGDYDKALFYYYRALKEFNYEADNGFYNLKILCYSYIGQIYFKTGRYQEGLDLLEIIELLLKKHSGEFYYICISNLRIRALHFLNEGGKIDTIITEAMKHVTDTVDFLEYSSDYLDLCRYAIAFKPEYARDFIDKLRENTKKVSLPFLMLNVQRLEVTYQEKYADPSAYLEACGEYVKVHQNYELINRKSKLGSLNNIEVLRKVQKECQLYLEQSKLDLMTGLLNKASFEQTVGNILQRKTLSSGRSLSKSSFALAIIDLDHFKEINDTFGHMEGDKALMEIVRFMTDILDDSVILGRIGGDEFGAFWSSVENAEALYNQVSEMQKAFISHCKTSSDMVYDASISIGIMFSDGDPLNYKELFQRADNELYKAKASGRATICLESVLN